MKNLKYLSLFIISLFIGINIFGSKIAIFNNDNSIFLECTYSDSNGNDSYTISFPLKKNLCCDLSVLGEDNKYLRSIDLYSDDRNIRNRRININLSLFEVNRHDAIYLYIICSDNLILTEEFRGNGYLDMFEARLRRWKNGTIDS